MMSTEWRKSSYSGNSGNCVEVRWQKSSHSGPNGNCVEARASAPGRVAIRDSKDKAGPRLTVNDRAWDAFVRGIKRGEFGI
jgi:hypothetical protein